MIVVNQVLKLEDDRIVRVLWVDDSYAYIFDLESLKVPEKVDISELYNASEEIEDIYAVYAEEKSLSEKHKEIRDKSWKLISDIIEYEPEVYQSTVRGTLIRGISEQSGTNRKNVYTMIKRYWQRGKVKDALLPDYKKCGQAKKKDSNELNKILEIVFKEHNRAKGKRTLKYSWKKMKMDYFAGSPESEIPSYGQFTKRYRDAFKKKSERERVIVGDKKYRKDISPNLSNSTLESNAPGKRYQIDATIADVHIVSEFDRADSISRPTVYLCIDVFSRMIAGVYIGLESPSMEGARMTILNCIEDKEEYCSRYDYSMSKDDWPVRSLPSNLLGDNAELRGLTVENAIMKLGIAIENTGSYRGDMKGIVERKFRSLHDRIKAVVKGMIMPDFQERGAPDYRKEARLTISEFSRIVFAWIKEEHNKYLQNYPPDIEIEKAGINKTPLELWKWGAQYRPQFLKTAPEMVVRAALLPSKMASVTQNGIRLHRHVHYTCDIAIKEDWFIRAKHNKSKMKVQLMFNKRNLREAYIYYKGEYLPVLPTINSDILKYSYEELLYIDKAEKKKRKKKAYENKEFQAFVNSEKEMQEIVRDADYLSGINSSSAKVNVTNVKENREIEKAAIKHLQKETPEVTVDQEVVESDTTTENDPILDAIRAISKKKKGRKDG